MTQQWQPSVVQVLDAVSQALEVPVSAMLGPTRGRSHVCTARHLAVYLCRTLTTFSYRDLAREFRRDESGLRHAVDVMRARLATDGVLAMYLVDLRSRLAGLSTRRPQVIHR